jgi:hypothetical protein
MRVPASSPDALLRPISALRLALGFVIFAALDFAATIVVACTMRGA